MSISILCYFPASQALGLLGKISNLDEILITSQHTTPRKSDQDYTVKLLFAEISRKAVYFRIFRVGWSRETFLTSGLLDVKQ